MNLPSLLLITAFLLTIKVETSACGNGNLQGSEQCDDGNNNDGDGCDSNCQKQPYYRCDTSHPNVCKLDVVISLKLVGVNRITFRNQGLLYLEPNYKLDIFNTIDFDSIFASSIPNAKLSATYLPQNNLIQLGIDYEQTLEQTTQSFKLLLTNTNKFWYDSLTGYFQLRGSNCQLTWQDNLWMSAIFARVLLAVVLITLIVVFVSICYQKWIGLELIQVYQSVYYILFLLGRYPYEFSPFFEVLRYSSGYDDVYQLDFQRFYTLPAALSALQIQKQFIGNINVNLIYITTVALVLVVLSSYKFKLKLRLQSQVNRSINKRIHKVSKYSRFVFGQVFVLLVLTLTFKIINSFAVQISQDSPSYQLIDDEINSTLGIITFLIVFIVIIYIFNWYIMIPDNLADGQEFHSLKFSNMKLFYPIMYLIYQIFFILTISIYYKRNYTIYILLPVQVIYFVLIIFIWPYNTPRKINRILHNFTILFNQFIVIFITCLMFRWKALLQSTPRAQNSLQFSIYVFIIFAFLVCSTVLTVIRLCIFNKDVQCIRQKQDQDGDEPNIIYESDKKALKQQMNIQRQNSINQTLNSNREQADIANVSLLSKIMHSQNRGHFLNEKQSNWKKNEDEEMNRSKKRNRVRNIIKTNNGNNAELIKTPIQEFQQMNLDGASQQMKES